MNTPTQAEALNAATHLQHHIGESDDAACNALDMIDKFIQRHPDTVAEPVAWRTQQPSKTHPWAFAWDQDQLNAWRETLGVEGEPLYRHPPACLSNSALHDPQPDLTLTDEPQKGLGSDSGREAVSAAALRSANGEVGQ